MEQAGIQQQMITITLPDGSQKKVAAGTTPADIAAGIGQRLAQAAVAGKINGQLVDLSRPIESDSEVAIITANSPEGIDIARHSTSHIMAQAVTRLFPSAKYTIGPVIDNGFYYDFDVETPFSPDDIVKIEAEMAKIIKEDHKFERLSWKRDESLKFFKDNDQPYKIELIEELEDEEPGIYKQGEFTDLCRGPHLPGTGKVKAFKLLSAAASYWRGDENKASLQRIYGTVFPDKKALKQHLHQLEEAKKRDHRKLGKELDLFSFSDEVGAGLPLFHPKGAMLKARLEQFWREEHIKRGYSFVQGPTILKKDLWEKSGHMATYSDNMYFTEVDESDFGIKPMNCLAHMIIYRSQLHSYRELPMRLFELGNVHRHEKSGVLHGLFRVRAFTQDDAHILCRPEQISEEVCGVMDLIDYLMNMFGFKYDLYISTRPEKSIGTDEQWDLATSALKEALKTLGRPFTINEGDGAFYGPKIDVILKDCLNREWQCSTIQCDFILPERFDLHYIDKDGSRPRPVMLHRAIMGSLERFMGIMIEHFAGSFPYWIAPEQVRILPVTDFQNEEGVKLKEDLVRAGILAEIDLREEKIGHKIRDAELAKVPYMLIVGKKETESGTISVRRKGLGDEGSVPRDELIKRLVDENKPTPVSEIS